MADIISSLQAAAGVSTGNPNAWDISKAYYDVGADAGDLSNAYWTGVSQGAGGGNEVLSIYIRPDGEKIYSVMASDDTIRQASLTIPWDLRTYSLDGKTFSTASQETTPAGMFFKTDGTKMYITGSSSDSIHEYTLSTAWDITTASFSQSFSVSARETAPSGLFFRDDGIKMYFCGFGNDKVYEYTLSSAWDISTASFVQDFSVASQDTTPNGVSFLGDGTKMYVSGITGNDINEYSLSTPWDISTASYVQNFSLFGLTSFPCDIFFKPDGTLFFTGDQSGTILFSFFFGGFSVLAEESSPQDLFFKPDGRKMYIVGATGDDVKEYDLSTAWDISTASYVQNFSVATEDISPLGLFFRSDGLKMYIAGNVGDDINEYSLSVAWDISTASYVQNFSVATEETSPQAVTFKSDGTKMYVVGSAGDDVNEYSLSTAWDISTASYVQNFSVASQDLSPNGIYFRSDGIKMYVSGSGSDKVNEYSLSTPWDISSASLTQSFSVGAQSNTSRGVFFKSDGTQFFMIDALSYKVLSYLISEE